MIVNSEGTPWLLLAAAEKLLGGFGKALVGIAVMCAVLTGIMGFYMASSRLMYSISQYGYLPKCFGEVDAKYRTPQKAMFFCLLVSLTGPVLGREALGWFLDMSAIGASIGYGATCLATLVTMKKDGDGSNFLKVMAIIGTFFSLAFIVLQLVPIPGFESVHFSTESYIMLGIWCVVGIVFYIWQESNV